MASQSVFRGMLFWIVLLLTPLTPLRAGASLPATLSFHCFSVRLASTTVQPTPGFVYRFEASLFNDGTINGELWPTVGETDPTSHATVMSLTVPGIDSPLRTVLYLDVPLLKDANLNALYDFFEVIRPVAGAKSVGQFAFDDGMDVFQGTAEALWTREAGTSQGTCKLRLKSTDLALDVTFSVPFEIYKYQGTLTYTLGPVAVPSLVDLTREGAPAGGADRIQGIFNLVRTNSSELGYLAGGWTNSSAGTLAFLSSAGNAESLLRGPLRTNYSTSLWIEDGLPATPETGEYQRWFLDIYDPNDSDHNRIPDLSDDIPDPGPIQLLGLTFRGASLRLTLTAPSGQAVVVEASDGLASPLWTPVTQTSATGGVDELDLGPLVTGARFYRLRSPP